MATFPRTASRHDPYRSFKFRVVVDGRTVAGVDKVAGLPGDLPSIALRKGDGLHQTHRSSHEAITLEHGVTQDADFEAWAQRGAQLGSVVATLAEQRRDILIEMHELDGSVARSWTLRKAWVSRYQALPDLDANANEVAIETLVLEHEGIET